jgi:hypothetical protein
MFRQFCLFAAASMVSGMMMASMAGAQEYPIMEKVAQKVIQKYQQATCEQLWQDKGKPKSEMEQKVIQLLKNDPQMRQAFIDMVAAPIANKMFECGMIP